MRNRSFCLAILFLAIFFVWPVFSTAQESGAEANDQHLSLDYGGLTRNYNVHLPPSYSPSTPMPVVILLHGGGGSIHAAYADHMDEQADRLGFILVIPNGTGLLRNRLLVWNVGTWSDNGCCGYAYGHNIDDIGFISRLIDDVKSKFAVDGRRIYATGISNGAVMAYLVGCQLPNKIAAVAPVAPPGIPDGCSNAKSVALIHVHGTGDTFAKYNGGTGGSLIPGAPGACFKRDANGGTERTTCTVEPTEQQVRYWVNKDHCTGRPTVVYQKDAATCYSYGSCANGNGVEFCRIEGAGHTWPSGAQYAPVSQVGPVSYDMSFAQIWDFLKQHTLPAAP